MSPRASLYRMFKPQDGEAAPMRAIIITLVGIALLLTAVGVVRVTREHEVLRLGFELSRATERLQSLEETRRELELERATLTAPERIKRLATTLGMTSVKPENIRVVTVTDPAPKKVAER